MLQTYAISREDFQALGQALAERHITSGTRWRFDPEDCLELQIGKGGLVQVGTKRFPPGVYRVRDRATETAIPAAPAS